MVYIFFWSTLFVLASLVCASVQLTPPVSSSLSSTSASLIIAIVNIIIIIIIIIVIIIIIIIITIIIITIIIVVVIVIITGAQPENFQGRGGFVEIGHFDKHFVKNTRKKGLAGKNFRVFPPRYSSNNILNRKFNTKLDTIRTFFSKIRALFPLFQLLLP